MLAAIATDATLAWSVRPSVGRVSKYGKCTIAMRRRMSVTVVHAEHNEMPFDGHTQSLMWHQVTLF